MQHLGSFKKAFLKHLLIGLHQSGVAFINMSFGERKRTINFISDVALAAARGGTKWSKAIIKDLSKQEERKILLSSFLRKEHERSPRPSLKWRMMRSKKILQRSFQVRAKAMKNVHGASGGVLAKAMMKKKTSVLRRLIPGAMFLDDLCLLDETIDYVISLRAQVDVMQQLVKALHVRRSK